MANSDSKRDDVNKVNVAGKANESSFGHMPVMRSRSDELSVWQSARRHKLLGVIAMGAAFSAALDGYRKQTSSSPIQHSYFIVNTA